MTRKTYSLIFLVVILISVFAVLNYIEAIGTAVVKSTTKATRYRVTYLDVQSGTSLTGSDVGFGQLSACKKFTLYTMGAQDQVVSFVTNVTTSFNLPSGAQVEIVAIRPSRAGALLSGGDIGLGGVLTWPSGELPHLENGFGSLPGYAFFSESATTDVVIYICNTTGTESLNNLTQGELDFYVFKIE